MSNAIKFTPQGGQVKVRLEQVVGEVGGVDGVSGVGGVGEVTPTAPTSPTSSTPPTAPAYPTYAQITVTDTGKGIRRDFLPNLF